MSERRHRTFVALCGLLVALGSLIALPSTSSAAALCLPPTSPPVTSANSLYYDVAVLSPCRAWAVGYDSVGGLIERWNGKNWVRQTSDDATPNPYLSAVAPVARNDVWATGVYVPVSYSGFIEHWNGTNWTRVTTPTLLNANFLEDISAVSKSDVWAVGSVYNGSSYVSLVEHWNGKKWKLVTHPQPGTSSGFKAVSGTSSKDVWAVGWYHRGSAPDQTLIEHWNGTTWKRMKTPNPGGGLHFNQLLDVVCTGARAAWAVGIYYDGVITHGLVLHWKGRGWKVHGAHPPSGGTVSDLEGVAASARDNVWWAGSATVAATTSAYVTPCC